MHRHEHTHFTQDDEQDAMTELLTDLVDDGLTRGLLALQYTYGLSIDTKVKYDVAAVAALRLLDLLPGEASVEDVRAGLKRRAVTLAGRDEYTDVRPMAMATPPGIPRCPSLSAAAGGEANDAAQ